MGNKNRNRNKKKNNGKKPAYDKNKTSATSASTTTEVKVDVKEITKDIQGISERTQADENNMQLDVTKLTDDKEDRNKSFEDIAASEESPNGEIPFMSNEKIKENIDAIEETVELSKRLAEQRKGMTSTQNPVRTNSVIEQCKYLDVILICEHREFFANKTRVIRLNEENIERMWNIFYSSSDKSKQDNKAKINQVLKVLKEVRHVKFPKNEYKSCFAEYTRLEELRKNKDKDSELKITEKKGDTSSSEKKPETSIENAALNEKTMAIANIVVDTPESYDEQKGKVIKLKKNDSINFRYETDDHMCITAGNDDYFTSEEKDITFNFKDENIQVYFTGNHINISTPDNEFDISFRKTDPVNLNSEATQTDNV